MNGSDNKMEPGLLTMPWWCWLRVYVGCVVPDKAVLLRFLGLFCSCVGLSSFECQYFHSKTWMPIFIFLCELCWVFAYAVQKMIQWIGRGLMLNLVSQWDEVSLKLEDIHAWNLRDRPFDLWGSPAFVRWMILWFCSLYGSSFSICSLFSPFSYWVPPIHGLKKEKFGDCC